MKDQTHEIGEHAAAAPDSPSRPDGGVGRRAVLGGLLVGLVPTMGGCAAIKAATGKVASFAGGLFADRPKSPEWRNVVISASQDANQNSPVALDIVFVKDAALSEALLASPASKWFATRRDLRRSFPDAMTAISLEVVPGQSIMLGSNHLAGHVGYTALAYANYTGTGEHRERLSLVAPGYVIELGSRGFRAAEVGKR